MSRRDEALLSWLSLSIRREINSVEELGNPQYFLTLCSKIRDFTPMNFSQCKTHEGWRQKYKWFKNLQQAFQSYYKDVLDRPMPSTLGPFNYLEIAKGQDTEGLISILIILFIACISSKQKTIFLETILNLDEREKEELMHLIEYDSNYFQVDNAEKEELEEKKRRIEELQVNIQSLYMENQSLRAQLFSEIEEQQKQQAIIQKQEEQNKNIRRQLEQKTLYLQVKQESEMQEENSTKIMSQTNQEVIEELKKQFLKQEKKYISEINDLKLKMEEMSETIQMLEEKNIQLEQNGFKMPNRKVDHENCVSLIQFKSRTNQLAMTIKNKQMKQMELERKIIELENELAENTRKTEKLIKQKLKIKEQYQKQKPRGQYITRKNGVQLQTKILMALKEDLLKRTKQLQKK